MASKAVLYDYAMRLVGLPYRWGGDDTLDGFDCSGLVLELLKASGAYAAHGADTTAAGLYQLFSGLPHGEPVFGSLAFYGRDAVSHVAFCLNESDMLEAGGGGHKTLTKDDAAKQNAYVRIRPIKSRNDLVGFRAPPYPWKGSGIG